MRDQNDSSGQRPADVRSISDPPDMGKLRPAEEVAKELVTGPETVDSGRFVDWTITVCALNDADNFVPLGNFDKDIAFWAADHLRDVLADVNRQSRAEGAVAVLEDIAAKCEAAGARTVALMLRARVGAIKGISDPPDMG